MQSYKFSSLFLVFFLLGIVLPGFASPPLSPVISNSGPVSFCAGGAVTLATISVSGVSYQWQKDGQDLNGKTYTSLTVTTSGIYLLKAGNAEGFSLSNSITVTVGQGASVQLLPSALSVCDGEELIDWTDGRNMVISEHATRSTVGVYNNGAKSVQELNGNGYFEYTIEPSTGLHTIFGLTQKSADAGYTSMDYGIHIDGALWVDVIDHGAYVKRGPQRVEGDRIKIVVQGNVVVFLYNDVLFWKSSTAPAFPLVANVSFYSGNDALHNAKMHKSSGNTNSTTLSISGASATAGYTWYINEAVVSTSSSYAYTNNLKNDQIKCLVNDGGACPSLTPVLAVAGTQPGTDPVSIGGFPTVVCSKEETIKWTEAVNVDISDASRVVKSAGGTAFNAGAKSVQEITSAGYFECVLTQNAGLHTIFGLSQKSAGVGTINFGFHLDGAGTWYIEEANSPVFSGPLFKVNDKFRIAVQEGHVLYYCNDVLLYTSSRPPVFPLVVNTVFYFQNAELKDAKIAVVPASAPAVPLVAQFSANAGDRVSKWFVNESSITEAGATFLYRNFLKGDVIQLKTWRTQSCIAPGVATKTTLVNNACNPIVAPSVDQPVCSGSNAVLSTDPDGGAVFQWQRNGFDIAGANTASYPADLPGKYVLKKSFSDGSIGFSNAVNVTILNSPLVSVSPNSTVCAGGKALLHAGNAALDFQGKIGNVNVPDFTWPGGAITIEFWNKVNTSDLQASSAFYSGGTQGVCHAHVPWSDKKLYWDYTDGIHQNGRLIADYSSYLDKWTHVALVSEGKTGTKMQMVYLDGKLVSSQVSGLEPVGLNILSIGAFLGNFYYKGSMDEFRIWNSARTPQQIEGNMYKELTGTEPGLAYYWPMDEGSGNVIEDKVHGAKGTINSVYVNWGKPDGAISYTWTGSGFTSNSQSALVAPLVSGDYVVTAVSSNGCKATGGVHLTLSQVTAPALTLDPPSNACKGQAIKATDVPGFIYQWKNGNNSVTNGNASTYYAVEAGPYSVNLSSSSCSTVSNIVQVGDQKAPLISPTADATICTGGKASLHAGNAALDFRGKIGNVNVPDFTWPGGAITIEFWNKVNTSDLQASSSFFSQGTQGYFHAHTPWADKKLYWDYTDGIQQNGRLTADYSSYLDKWTHVALVSEGKTGTKMQMIYLDGKLVSSQVSGLEPEGLKILSIGAFLGSYYFKGSMDEFRIWNSARTPQQIQDNMYKEQTGAETGLSYYWPMDEGSGNVIEDRVHGAKGTINSVYVNWGKPDGAVSYTWTGSGFTSNNQSALVAPQASGDYVVTAVGSNGCKATGGIHLTLSPVPAPAFTLEPATNACKGQAIKATDVPGFNYQWKNGYAPIPNGNTSTYYTLEAGLYSVNISSSSCSTMSEPVAVNNEKAPLLISSQTINVGSNGSAVLNASSSGIKFNGSNSYVNIPDFTWPGGAITIEFWNNVKTSDLQANSAFFSSGSQGFCHAHVPWADKMLYWDYTNSAPPNGRLSVDYSSYLDKWTHVALVSEGKTGSKNQMIYLDGKLVASQNSGIEPVGLNILSIGAYIGNYYYKGTMHEFRIWNSARTQEDIQNNMYKGLEGDEPDLFSYWRMDEQTGTMLHDATVRKNDGQTINSTWYINTSLTYLWSPALGLSTTTGPSVTATPLQNTIYTVQVTNSTLCKATEVFNVIVMKNNKAYYVLNSALSAPLVALKDELNFMYKENYTGGTLNYKMYDYQKLEVSALLPLNKTYGENYFTLKLADIPTLTKGKIYLLEVTNEKKEKQFLRFLYQ